MMTVGPTALPVPPVHIAIIMDGNGRWARARGLPRAEGHRRGAEAVERTVTAAGELGVGYLTLYGFSSENWKRPPTEVTDLMGLLRYYLETKINRLHRDNVILRVIGDRARLPTDIVQLIETAEQTTAENTGLTLIMALSYGARDEIVAASRRLAMAVRDRQLSLEDITETAFSDHLFTKDFPDPDMLIRTSGEKRLSNFLLWQCAYAELFFFDILWPDFNRQLLEQAIDAYHHRDRRYGSIA